MFYTVYKTTNTTNGRDYIGKHKTNDINDGYLGSGKLLKQAIKKYGKDSFVKEVLFVFDNEKEMNDKERELVILSEDSYNLCEGGNGGFGYINSNGLGGMKGKKHSDKTKAVLAEQSRNRKPCLGHVLTEDHKQKIGYANKIALKGTNKSDEHKRKISEAIKLKWELKKNCGIGI